MRSLKKVSAIFLAIAMLISLVTINVSAAISNQADYVLSYKYYNASGSEITSTKADKDIYLEIYISKWNYNKNLTIYGELGTVVAPGDIVINYDNFDEDGLTADLANKNITLSWQSGVKVEDKALAKIKIHVPASQAIGSMSLFKLQNTGMYISCNNKDGGKDTGNIMTQPEATINVAESFNVNHYSKAYTAGIGTSADAIITALGDTATAYENVDETTGKNAEVKVGPWTAPADFNADDTSKTYAFTAPVLVEANEDSLANVTANQTATATVTLGKIDLATDTAVTTDAPSEKDYMLSKTAGEVKAGTAIASELPTTVKIKKGDKYEEEATVAWAPKAGSKTELDLTKLTSEDTTNIVTLVGTITPSATNTNYTGTKTVECVAKVVPAEITGSKFSVDNAAQYGNAKVAFTIPGAEVNGKKVSAYMYTKLTTDGKIDETSLVANSKVETEEITAEVSSEEGATPVTYKDYTGSLQFASFDSLGLKTNDKFYVVLKVDTATVKNGEDMYVESYVLPESNRRPNNGGGNSGGTVVVKKHDVKVTEGTNGTATVDKEAKVGDTVKVDVKPNEGYKVKEIIVKTADGKTVEVDQKNRTFVMPDGDVTVEVVYEEGTEEPTVADGKFTDVPDTFWAAADIYTLKEAGIINGKSDKEFDPEGKVTRAEFTKMIVNLFGVKASQNTVAFTDCKADDWFTPFVAAAVEAGYVKGITDTEFAPDKTITREEACTILGRAYAKTSDKALNFTDASGISDFATAYVALLVDMGYVNGYEDGTFLPKNEITRAEAAKIIASAFRAAEKAKTEVTEDKTEAKDNADADVKADDKTDAKADDKTEVKADDKTDAKADAKTDAKADNGETPEK